MLTTSQRSSRCIARSSRTLSTSISFVRAPPWRLVGDPSRQRRKPARSVPGQTLRSRSRILNGLRSSDTQEKTLGRGIFHLSPPGLVKQLRLDQSTVDRILISIEKDLKGSPLLEGLGLDSTSFKRPFFGYRQAVLDVFRDGDSRQAQGLKEPGSKEPGKPSLGSTYSKETLEQIYRDGGSSSLTSALKYGFYGHIASSKFSTSDLHHQKQIADLRYPNEWFPATRTMHRTVHLHVGPTNSGKTYHALKKLEEANSGVYAGPLRLLAHEVYARLNAKGKRCLLVTGEERRSPDDTMSGSLSSCTVEMVPLNTTLDVAVIDEIQMMGSPDRGWAWTEAFLGLKARELHVCGEERSVPLVRELAASVGDKLEIHKYERLSPLQVAKHSLKGNLRNLHKGDCIVSFSVMGIHALRREIEKVTGRKVAIVYGSLPPETRAQQARLFNDPNNDYDFLVASDAIGMGLNLSIKRIIFETTSKRRGSVRNPLAVHEVKQIAGRAGRYRTAHQDIQEKRADEQLVDPQKDTEPGHKGDTQEAVPENTSVSRQNSPRQTSADTSTNTGYVTTLDQFDFPFLDDCMNSDPEPITSAGVLPPGPVVERFARYFPPGTPFSYILLRLHEIAKLHTRFHLCELRDQLSIADAIQPVKGLTTMDRIIFCAAPVASRAGDEGEMKLVRALAECVEQQQGGNLLDIPEIPLEVLDEEPSSSRDYLRRLERLHKGIILYLWLGYRFSGVFNTQALAMHVKGLVEAAIEKTLAQFSFNLETRRKIRAQREQEMIRQLAGNFSPDETKAEDAQVQESISEAPIVDVSEEQEKPDQRATHRDRESNLAQEESVADYDPDMGSKEDHYLQSDLGPDWISYAKGQSTLHQDMSQASREAQDFDTSRGPTSHEDDDYNEYTRERPVDHEPESPDDIVKELEDEPEDLSRTGSSHSGQSKEREALHVLHATDPQSDLTENDSRKAIPGILDHDKHDSSPTQTQTEPK